MTDRLEPKEGDRIEKPYDPDVNKGFTHSTPPPKPFVPPSLPSQPPSTPPATTPKK